MKRQLILSLAIVFTLALFAPAVSYAFNSSPVVIVDNKEKKDETKATTTEQTEKKDGTASTDTKACCNKSKACCNKEMKSGCCKDSTKMEKTSAGEKKACCASQKENIK